MLLCFEAHDLGSDVLQRAQQFASALGQKNCIRTRHLDINLAGLKAVGIRAPAPAMIRYFNRKPPVVVRVFRSAAIFWAAAAWSTIGIGLVSHFARREVSWTEREIPTFEF